MRFRVSAAVVTGALALTALSAPAAQADEAVGNTKISNVVVNGGKAVVLGTSAKKTVTVTFTASDNSGIKEGLGALWYGKNINAEESGVEPQGGKAKCGKGTKASCKMTFVIDPTYHLYKNSLAGGWKTLVGAVSRDNNYQVRYNAKSFNMQRLSKISINAAPEPVKKGKDLTITGSLTRANWETGKYAGYTKQPVKLQFRKKGGKTFTTVKTVRTDSKGNLRTTVKAGSDGTYRYSFAGTSTTPAVTNGGDFVDVR
ncbi:calcium-binding protein [Streptomyces sp. NPDC014894]|uniref:calcium-binding protein n=1 Tax=unclassified Streptomyces TaxID=2593676 RepID=UPI0037008EC4